MLPVHEAFVPDIKLSCESQLSKHGVFATMAESLPKASLLREDMAVLLQKQQAEIMDCIDHWLAGTTPTSTNGSGSSMCPTPPQTSRLVRKKLPPELPPRGSAGLPSFPEKIPVRQSPSPNEQIQALIDAIKTLQDCQARLPVEGEQSSKDVPEHDSEKPPAEYALSKLFTASKLGARTFSHIEERKDPLLKRVLSSPHYDICILALVIIDAFVTGWQVQRDAIAGGKHEDDIVKRIMTIYEVTLLAIFMCDVGLRMFVHKWGFYFTTDWRWNIFDMTLVCVMFVADLMKVVAHNTSNGFRDFLEHASILRIMRIARIFKVLRMVRVVAGLKDLRLMFNSLAGSFQPLCAICVVLALTLYIFGIALVVGTMDYLDYEDAWESEETERLRFHFARLDAAIVSLFEAMAGGISWGELRTELEPLEPPYRIIFMMYILFSILGVVNIVTGVFVDSALGNSKRDHDLMVEEEQEKKAKMLRDLHILFEEIDADQSGSISYQEIMTAHDDERMRSYMNAIGVCLEDVQALFTLLDVDKAGKVEVEEFINGCIRLHGPASNMELAKVELENKLVVKGIMNVRTQMDEMQRLNANIAASVKLLVRCSALGVLNATCEAPRFHDQCVEEANDMARQAALDLESMYLSKDLAHI